MAEDQPDRGKPHHDEANDRNRDIDPPHETAPVPVTPSPLPHWNNTPVRSEKSNHGSIIESVALPRVIATAWYGFGTYVSAANTRGGA